MGASSLCIPQSTANDIAIAVPALAFLAFLAWSFQASMRKLRRSRSHIMATYYAFLWALTLLNLLRSLVQIGQHDSGQPVLWNVLLLVTRCGMIALEVSVVVFLLQGHLTSGRQALLRTLYISGSTAAVDLGVKVVYIFALHVPLFLYGGTPESAAGDMRWSKWSFWLLHSLAAALVYAAIVVLPCTPWRDAVPAKRAFYRYAQALLGVYALMAAGAALIGSGAAAGYCVYGAASWMYYAGYAPLLYATFLSEFFADEQLDLDLMYYSEMREAGYIDDEGEAY